MLELRFLRKLILIRQVNQKSAIFVITSIFQIKGLNFNQMSAMDAMTY